MNFLSACEIPEGMKEPHASDYRRRLVFALHDPSTPERKRREISLLLNTPSGTKPYMALAALRKEK